MIRVRAVVWVPPHYEGLTYIERRKFLEDRIEALLAYIRADSFKGRVSRRRGVITKVGVAINVREPGDGRGE